MKTLLIDAICGVGFPSIEIGAHAADSGAARFIGNHEEPDWRWNRSVLELKQEAFLQDLYESLREATRR